MCSETDPHHDAAPTMLHSSVLRFEHLIVISTRMHFGMMAKKFHCLPHLTIKRFFNSYLSCSCGQLQISVRFDFGALVSFWFCIPCQRKTCFTLESHIGVKAVSCS
ncbi:hypothetical protein XENORESO_006652 [Xenotaenia resolanae]|uniref:Uncharacterized protein n=1 Tax=Xenotaenia resolanae TaxID=208358 RepID=A0ABV0VNA7_9TELE